ncbi:hypothetical protein ACPEIC_38560 [Stenotrophomonas sp. NPDC087984]
MDGEGDQHAGVSIDEEDDRSSNEGTPMQDRSATGCSLGGIAGPDAAANWRRLEKAEDYARMNAVFRFLFAAVIIHPTTSRNSFDTDRIEIEPNPLD